MAGGTGSPPPSYYETRSEIDIYGLPGMLKRTTPAFRRGLLRRRLRIETNCQLFSYLTGVTGILSFRRNVTWPPSPSSFYQPRIRAYQPRGGFARSRVKGKCFSLRGEREGAVFPSRFFSIRTARNTRRPPADHGRSVKFT